jgi:eukaryotic-like serine/threonine-protein kinase
VREPAGEIPSKTRDLVLTPGEKVGIYEVVSSLGAGGMGEVYRARDTKLQRDVALKILPETMARDAQRMARFEREAQVLASLNHPNIAAIYGLEESNGVRALVMELVEGETLGEKIVGTGSALPREPQGLPYEEALPIAKQVAEALEYAHERGVIHRDLKPANVKITPEGTVKVLDFGLAKVLDTHDSTATMDMANSPTLSGMATQAGMILGTAAYMSPEQAKGQRVDRRADIWAFGCVLYEMLTGRKPFEGETISDVLAAVIRAEPEWTAIPEATPPSIQRLVRRCLIKDAKQRLRDIGDARITIDETISGTGVPPVEVYGQDAHATSADNRTPPHRALPWVAASVVLICLAVAAGWWIRGQQATQNTRWSGDLLAGSNIAFGPRISPDGHTLAFQAMVDNLTQVAVSNPDSGNWTVLTHDRTRGTVHEISWSPDGSKLYFDRLMSKPEGIYSVPSLGGDERLVLRDAAGPKAFPDGSLLIWRVDEERRDRLYHFWPDSGRIEPLGAWIAPTYPVEMHRVFPDGKEAVFYGWDESVAAGASPNLYAIDIASGKTHQLAPELPIRMTSEGFPMAPTANNRSVLIDLPSGGLHQIVAIPRSGSGPVRVLMTLTTPPWTTDVGPDGSIYLDQVDRPYQILRFPTSGGTPEVLATSPAFSVGISAPVEFPDGRLLIPALDSGRSKLLIGKPGGNFFPLSDTREENRLPATLLPGNQVAFVAGTGSGQTIVIASAADGRISRRLQGCKGIYVNRLAASRDGRTLYYSAKESIWAIPATDGKPHKIAPGDGVVVDPNGKDLIISSLEKSGESLFRVPLSGGPPLQIHIQGNVTLNPLALGEHSLSKDGKLVVGVTSPDSWFFSAAVLDLATGRGQRIPLNFTGDILQSRWTNDGHILALAEPMQAHIWRFQPTH